MSNKKYLVFAVSLMTFFSGATALASPGHGGAVHEGERSPETQIGLSGSVIGQKGGEATTSGMTREEVAALIHDIQEPEETRSLIKLSLLVLAIAGLIELYSPRKQSIIPAPLSTAEIAQVPTDAAGVQPTDEKTGA